MKLQIIDEMARCACLGTIWGINGGATVGGPPLARYGSPMQKEKYFAPLCAASKDIVYV